MNCCHTTPHYHTGTVTPTDIGPSTGGKLYSITICGFGSNLGEAIVVRDGGSGGDIILSTSGGPAQPNNNQFRWEGLKINGQLNVALGNDSIKVTIEMSD
jgi:hypothetical protein